MKLFLMRHGQAENNVRNIISHSPGCWSLTARGRKQVAAAANELNESTCQIDNVLISPLLRAQETYEIMKNRCEQVQAAPVNTLESLTEIHMGDWNNRQRCAESNTLFAQRSRERRSHNFSPFRLPYGESFRELALRMTGFLSDYIVNSDTDSSLLIISHADPLFSLQRVIKLLTNYQLPASYPNNAEIISIDLSMGQVSNLRRSLRGYLLQGADK